MTTILLPFPDDNQLASAVARSLEMRIGRLERRHFPDGESLITIEEALKDHDVAFFFQPTRSGP